MRSKEIKIIPITCNVVIVENVSEAFGQEKHLVIQVSFPVLPRRDNILEIPGVVQGIKYYSVVIVKRVLESPDPDLLDQSLIFVRPIHQ